QGRGTTLNDRMLEEAIFRSLADSKPEAASPMTTPQIQPNPVTPPTYQETKPASLETKQESLPTIPASQAIVEKVVDAEDEQLQQAIALSLQSQRAQSDAIEVRDEKERQSVTRNKSIPASPVTPCVQVNPV